MKTKQKKKKTKTPKIAYLVKWGDYGDDPVEEFTSLEKAKEKAEELIKEGENKENIIVYKVMAIMKPVVTFEEIK
jgi:hypothetical protein